MGQDQLYSEGERERYPCEYSAGGYMDSPTLDGSRSVVAESVGSLTNCWKTSEDSVCHVSLN